MKTITVKADIHNGVVQLPAQYAAQLEGQAVELTLQLLTNQELASAEAQEEERRRHIFADAAAKLTAMRAYRNIETIEDAVIWQRRIRDEWERPLPGRDRH
ncbi:MAG: hypothetical protein EOO57_12280 [Hymenobacter sp.]|nr:MAG: hypothetical protein EOO57_12280 [Hymenobacter sp.]